MTKTLNPKQEKVLRKADFRRRILFDAKLLPSTKLVIFTLLEHHNDGTDRCDPSEELLAEEVHFSIRTVERAMEDARKRGCIKTKRRFDKSQQYFFVWDYDTSIPCKVSKNKNKGHTDPTQMTDMRSDTDDGSHPTQMSESSRHSCRKRPDTDVGLTNEYEQMKETDESNSTETSPSIAGDDEETFYIENESSLTQMTIPLTRSSIGFGKDPRSTPAPAHVPLSQEDQCRYLVGRDTYGFEYEPEGVWELIQRRFPESNHSHDWSLAREHFDHLVQDGVDLNYLADQVVRYVVSRRTEDPKYNFSVQNWLSKDAWKKSYPDIINSLDAMYRYQYENEVGANA